METQNDPETPPPANEFLEKSTHADPAGQVLPKTTSEEVSAQNGRNHGVGVVAGGLFALFVTLLIQAFTIFGVTSITVGHLFLAGAWVVGSLILVHDVFPSRSKRLKVMSVVGLALALATVDLVVVAVAKNREAQKIAQASPAASPENLGRAGPQFPTPPPPTPATTQSVPQITPSVPDRTRVGQTGAAAVSSADDRARALRQEAQGLVNSGNYQEAIAKLNQALAIPGITEGMETRLKTLRIEAVSKASGRGGKNGSK